MKPKLQTEKTQFLADLLEMAKSYGWSGDYTEIMDFMDWCCDTLGAERFTTEQMESYQGSD